MARSVRLVLWRQQTAAVSVLFVKPTGPKGCRSDRYTSGHIGARSGCATFQSGSSTRLPKATLSSCRAGQTQRRVRACGLTSDPACCDCLDANMTLQTSRRRPQPRVYSAAYASGVCRHFALGATSYVLLCAAGLMLVLLATDIDASFLMRSRHCRSGGRISCSSTPPRRAPNPPGRTI